MCVLLKKDRKFIGLSSLHLLHILQFLIIQRSFFVYKPLINLCRRRYTNEILVLKINVSKFFVLQDFFFIKTVKICIQNFGSSCIFLFCYLITIVHFAYSVWTIAGKFILIQCFKCDDINHTYGFNCNWLTLNELTTDVSCILLLCRFPARNRLLLKSCCRLAGKWRDKTKTMSRSPRRRRCWPRTKENSLSRSPPQVTKGNHVTCKY